MGRGDYPRDGKITCQGGGGLKRTIEMPRGCDGQQPGYWLCTLL